MQLIKNCKTLAYCIKVKNILIRNHTENVNPNIFSSTFRSHEMMQNFQIVDINLLLEGTLGIILCCAYASVFLILYTLYSRTSL